MRKIYCHINLDYRKEKFVEEEINHLHRKLIASLKCNVQKKKDFNFDVVAKNILPTNLVRISKQFQYKNRVYGVSDVVDNLVLVNVVYEEENDTSPRCRDFNIEKVKVLIQEYL